MKKHLAILTQPYLDLLLCGKKTIESRFSKVHGLPHGRVEKGDIVLLKKSGGLVLGEFTVGKVMSYTNADDVLLEKVKMMYAKEICSDVSPTFWKERKGKKYITLMYVESYLKYDNPYPFPKKDMRPWVILEHSDFSK